MSVRDPLADGGIVPEGPAANQEGARLPRKITGFADVRDAVVEAEKIRAFRDTLYGGGSPVGGALVNAPRVSEGKQEEKTTLDIAAVVKSQSDLIGTMLGQITGLVTGKKEGSDPFMLYLMSELKDMKGRLEGSDPVQGLLANVEAFKMFTNSMKDHLGLSNPVANTGGNAMILLELEKLKGEREERSRQWEDERDARRRREQIEDQKWLRQIQLQEKELTNRIKTQEDAKNTIGDVLGGILAGIDNKMVEEEPGVSAAGAPAMTPRRASPKALPKDFECECGETISVPDGHNASAALKCGHCGAEYNFE